MKNNLLSKSECHFDRSGEILGSPTLKDVSILPKGRPLDMTKADLRTDFK
jgi:hypothetical protein